MEVTNGAEEGFIREWTPCSHIMNMIPLRIHYGLFSSELCLTCVDAVTEYIALGTNLGLVYWYDRKKGNIQRLRCETSTSPITFVKIVSTVDYMVGAGNEAGQVTVFQIPKEHPENVPDNLKPKVEPKVERYTIGDLHKSKITSIEWSKNGMRLFSGDKNGVIIMTEIDFYMHLCKSMEIVNEEHEIVQLSYYQNSLLVSSLYRTIVCERRDNKWHVTQIGKKERKSLCRLGAVFSYSYARGGGGAPAAYCARGGLRLWRAGGGGDVHHTLLFKEAISSPLSVAELLNPAQHKTPLPEPTFANLRVFREEFLIAHDDRTLYVLDPRTLVAVAAVHDLRKIVSVSVNRDEIFVLEGPRSLVRLAHAPDPAALKTEDPINLMTKSLTTSIQNAVNTVNSTLDQTVPYITSVLEQPIALFTKHEGSVSKAEECFELPPIKELPKNLSENVLESIINEFKDVNDDDFRKIKSEEIERKLQLYSSMVGRCDEEVIHSRKSRRSGSGGATPRKLTPVRKEAKDVSYTTPCVMNVSIYGNIDQTSEELLEKQIEEKEKILAKMLNLESLGIASPIQKAEDDTSKEDEILVIDKMLIDNNIPVTDNKNVVNVKQPKNEKSVFKELESTGFVPEVLKLPINWNLENIQLKTDLKATGDNNKRNLDQTDDSLELDWEII